MTLSKNGVAVALALVAGSACYHATIETGATPSAVVIKKAFASSWIYGLVPPSPVQTASQCANGVARIETQLSFVNQLVGFLTLGIYTPMEITVTCAAAGSASLTPSEGDEVIRVDGDSPNDFEDAVALALRRSIKLSRPVFVVQ